VPFAFVHDPIANALEDTRQVQDIAWESLWTGQRIVGRCKVQERFAGSTEGRGDAVLCRVFAREKSCPAWSALTGVREGVLKLDPVAPQPIERWQVRPHPLRGQKQRASLLICHDNDDIELPLLELSGQRLRRSRARCALGKEFRGG
jgi:hypothetical protein